MAALPSVPRLSEPAASLDRRALPAMAALFFLLGLLTSLNDILVPHLKIVFDLGYAGASLVQVTFFSAYFLLAVPSGWFLSRVGYHRGLVVSLAVAGAGALLFLGAASVPSYGLFLGALFVLAGGFALLQVAANPYITALGPAATASSRLTLTQAFNSLGTTLGPALGSLLILSPQPLTPDGATAIAGDLQRMAQRAREAAVVRGPYLGLSLALFALAAVVAVLKLPTIQAARSTLVDLQKVWKIPRLRGGVYGIFFYVGAEVTIGSFLVNFLGDTRVLGLAPSTAAHYVALYWGGAMIGRFAGTPLLTKFPPPTVLSVLAAAAILLVTSALGLRGGAAAGCLLAVGLCNSVMFPTIFALAVEGLDVLTPAASGLLITAVVGGAVIPLTVGVLADHVGLSRALPLVLVSYGYIVWYGRRTARKNSAVSALCQHFVGFGQTGPKPTKC